MQTTLPPYASNLREGWSKIVAQEGYGGLYKGLYPLWARQIPYTMVKFATFESAVAQIYKTLGKPKESYGTLAQTGVSFLGGYIAGIGCAVISHPADVMVSKLNADRKAGESAGQAISRIYANIGFRGLWNGLPVRIGMIGTLTAFQWLIYDSFKVYLGVSLVPSCALFGIDDLGDFLLTRVSFSTAPYHRWPLIGTDNYSFRRIRIAQDRLHFSSESHKAFGLGRRHYSGTHGSHMSKQDKRSHGSSRLKSRPKRRESPVEAQARKRYPPTRDQHQNSQVPHDPTDCMYTSLSSSTSTKIDRSVINLID
jgi:hypothetical protein